MSCFRVISGSIGVDARWLDTGNKIVRNTCIAPEILNTYLLLQLDRNKFVFHFKEKKSNNTKNMYKEEKKCLERGILCSLALSRLIYYNSILYGFASAAETAESL